MTLTHIHPSLRLMTSALVIFGVLAAVAGVSSALLQTNEVSATSNEFSVASGDILEIAKDDGGTPDTWGETIADAFNATAMVPGGPAIESTFWLRNTSTEDLDVNLAADLANFTFSSASNPDLSSSETDLDGHLKVKFFCNAVTPGGTAEKTLTGWTTSKNINTPFNVGGTTVLSAGEEALCAMTTTLDSDSESAGHTATFDAFFIGNQIVPSSSPTPTPTPSPSPEPEPGE